MSRTLPQLDEATSLRGSDELLINSSGNPRRMSAANAKTFLNGAAAFDLRDYKQAGDGNDWLPAFNRIQALVVDPNRGALIQCPAGQLNVSDTLHIYKKLYLRGAGNGAHGAITQLIWPKNKTAIRCWSGAEVNRIRGGLYGPYPWTAGYTAEYTLIEDLGIFCLDSATTVGCGVWTSAAVRLNRVSVQGFGEDGVRIFAYNPDQGGLNAGTGMANMWYISDSVIRSNKGNGLLVQGADANAGIAHMIFGGNNSEWDFVDYSYAGNTYVACQSDAGGKGSYKGFAGSTLVGCYNESKATALHYSSLVVGGVLSDAFQSPVLEVTGDGADASAVVTAVDGNGTVTKILPRTFGSGYSTAAVNVIKHGDGSGLVVAPNIIGGHVSSYTIVSGGSGYAGGRGASPGMLRGSAGIYTTGAVCSTNFYPESARYVEAALCYKGNQFFTGKVYNNSINDYELLFWPIWRESIKVYDCALSETFIRITSKYSTTEKMGRSSVIPAGSIQLPNGFWLGGGQTGSASTDGRHITNGTAAPTTGEWARGDIVFNLAPTSGGFVGWICTLGGTPGTWKTFGPIS